ncbi:hypothetical protein [Flavobacterium gyeonganense]|uniref:Lipoprotein n=1 Tax=Flavobacterium gyeonganense TaxID=1310418 RepID=A0ABV5H8M0_9FLAO|nr:hypothetical protein [Flavobacterium gyeonganense]
MRKLIFLITLLGLLTSCCNEPMYSGPDDNYATALDTLKNYNDYILGKFDGKFLVSTNVFSKGYSASIVSNPNDSSYIQYQIAYKLKENNVEKSAFVSFRLLESKAKLNSGNNYRYKSFADFVHFFDRNTFVYYQENKPIEKVHNVWVKYQNLYNIDNDIYEYDSYKFENKISPKNFSFIIDSINVIENPIKKVEVYYSFKCIGVNSHKNKISIESGKGKSTFQYNEY